MLARGKDLPKLLKSRHHFVIPSGARNLSGGYADGKKERFLAPLGMTKSPIFSVTSRVTSRI
jgi:hypothetical protein